MNGSSFLTGAALGVSMVDCPKPTPAWPSCGQYRVMRVTPIQLLTFSYESDSFGRGRAQALIALNVQHDANHGAARYRLYMNLEQFRYIRICIHDTYYCDLTANRKPTRQVYTAEVSHIINTHASTL